MRGAICPEGTIDPDTGAAGGARRGIVKVECPRTADVLDFPPPYLAFRGLVKSRANEQTRTSTTPMKR